MVGTAVILISITAIAVLLVLLPFDGRRRDAEASWESPEVQAGDLETLLAKKDSIYVGIKDLEFEYDTGKLSQEDYETLKEAYARDAIQVLKAIDECSAALAKARGATKRQSRRGSVRTTGVKVFCSSCGAELDQSDKFCTSCGASQSLVCAQCGASCDRGTHFCSGCGAELAIVAK